MALGQPTNWGHGRDVPGAIVETPYRCGHFCYSPVVFRLHLNEAKAEQHRHVCRMPPKRIVEVLRMPSSLRYNERHDDERGQYVEGYLSA